MASVGVTAPITSTGGATPTIGITQSGAASNGFLSSTDWNTFNNKTSSQWTTTGSNVYYNTGGVSIGNTSTDASAILELNSNTKGILISRMTLTEKNAIASPATGLLVYQTDGVSGFYYNAGDAETPSWQTFQTQWTNSGSNIYYTNRIGIGSSSIDAKAKLYITGSVSSDYLFKIYNSSVNGGAQSVSGATSNSLVSMANDGAGYVLDLSNSNASGAVLNVDGSKSSGYVATVNTSSNSGGALTVTCNAGTATSSNIFYVTGKSSTYAANIANTNSGGGLTITSGAGLGLNVANNSSSNYTATLTNSSTGGGLNINAGAGNLGLNITGRVKITQLSGSLTDNTPTGAQITTIVGANAATVGAGYHVTIKDSDGTGLLYRVESDGANWFYTVMTQAL